MRKLLIAITMFAVAAVAGAAQCEGVTKTGERCKREADAGKKYCIGHADQAKKPEAKVNAKEKDEGRCWAVTEAGARCKRKRIGESDYCKQHSPDVKPSKPLDQCRAMTYDGKRCSRKPEEGRRYCKQHMK